MSYSAPTPLLGNLLPPAPNTFGFTWLGGSEWGDRARKGSRQDNNDYSKHAPGGLVGWDTPGQ